jgi:hypothetical protein
MTGTGRKQPATESSRRLAQPLVGQLLVLHPGNLDVDVDAVQEGTGDALLVAADHGVRTGAFMYLVTT